MPDFTLADILAAQAGAPGPVYEGGPTGNVTMADVLGPSWLDRARQQTQRDAAAYQSGGVPALMADRGETADLSGGFGGTIKPVGPSKIVSGSPDFGRAFLLERNRTPANAPEGYGLPPEPQQSIREQLGAVVNEPTRYNVSDLRPPVAEAPTTTFHGSNAPLKSLRPDSPLYLAKERDMAQGYATEKARAHGGEPTVSTVDVDLSRFATPEQYASILDRLYPNESWVNKFNSQAATVADPQILAELRKGNYQGARDLWDFGHHADFDERQVHVLLDPTAGRLADQPSGIRAYHGSPYDFDKFDLSKIGTGEGAQAYGHGFYYSENPAVAQEYKRRLSPGRGAEAPDVAARILNADGINGDRLKAIQEAQYRIDSFGPSSGRRTVLHDALDLLKSDAPIGGRMYEVNINAKPEQFLNYDAPAPQIAREAASQALKPSGMFTLEPERTLRGTRLENIADPQSSGQDLYQALSRGLAGGKGFNAAAASDVLKEAGIPGIRYLDEGSRPQYASVTGVDLNRNLPKTSNYVVFNPDIVDIRKKWALLLAAMGGAGAPTMGDVMRSQAEPPPQ